MGRRPRRKRATASTTTSATATATAPPEAKPAKTGSRETVNTWLALIAASGVLATVVGFALDRYYDRIVDAVTGANENAALAVHIDDDGGFAAIEGSVWALPGPPPAESTDAALRSTGAVAIGRTIVGVTVENVGKQPLTMVSVKAVRHARQDTIADTLVRVAPGGGGAEPPPINLGFALDTSDLEARVVEHDELTATRYLDRYGVTLGPGEQLRLRLAGYVTTHNVGWSVVLRYVIDGEDYVADVGSDKQQFHVTGASERYVRAYEWAAQDVRLVAQADICGADCRASLKRGRR